MRRITLPGTAIATSALGFGCAHLMARVRRRESRRILETAFDAGITHFDVARLYGYGEAESVLGEFMKGRRDLVTVATKFGIQPPRASRPLRLAKAAARAMVAISPRLRTTVRARAARMVSTGHFDLASARRSFETSLRELRTDYVDLLLLHECRPADLDNLAGADALLDYLEACVAQGSVRAFGIATDVGTVRYAAAERPRFARVVQFPSDAINRNVEAIGYPLSAVVTHSPLGEGLRRLRSLLAESPEAADAWSSALGIDALDATELGRLMLAAAMKANPRGPVVFSSLQERNIRANGAVAEAGSVTDGQLSAFLRLASEARLSPPLRA